MTSIGLNCSSRNETGNNSIPGKFNIYEGGKSAVKYFYLTNDKGEEKTYSFRIFFTSNSNQERNLEILKKYNTSKVETLGKMSVELGLGEKYRGLSFSGSGEKSKLDLTRYDGTIKHIDSKYFKSKDLKSVKLKLRMYQTLSNINMESQGTIKKNEYINTNAIGLKMELLKKAEQLFNCTQNWYTKDNIKVSIKYGDLFANLENANQDKLDEFLVESKKFRL